MRPIEFYNLVCAIHIHTMFFSAVWSWALTKTCTSPIKKTRTCRKRQAPSLQLLKLNNTFKEEIKYHTQRLVNTHSCQGLRFEKIRGLKCLTSVITIYTYTHTFGITLIISYVNFKFIVISCDLLVVFFS